MVRVDFGHPYKLDRSRESLATTRVGAVVPGRLWKRYTYTPTEGAGRMANQIITVTSQPGAISGRRRAISRTAKKHDKNTSPTKLNRIPGNWRRTRHHRSPIGRHQRGNSPRACLAAPPTSLVTCMKSSTTLVAALMSALLIRHWKRLVRFVLSNTMSRHEGRFEPVP